MPILHAEAQVAGHRASCTSTQHSLLQRVAHTGQPTTDMLAGLIRLTLTGLEALENLWAELAVDSYRQVSGHVGFFHEEGHTFRRLTFYDAYCVHYTVHFDARGQNGRSSLETDVYFAPTAINLDGTRVENYSKLWWEKDPVVRFNALNKPPELLPSPALRATLRSAPPPLPPTAAPPQAPKPPKTALDPQQKPLYAPAIAKWYRKGGIIELLDNGNWKYTDWEHNSVVYEGDEPNFDKYARQQVDIEGMIGDCDKDFAKADELAPLGPILDGNTWHHKQNMRTMQEVDFTIHRRFTHYGARSLLKQQANSAPTQSDSAPVTKRVLRKKQP
ncbi:type VI secretion system tube protein TssD [Hymenobacter weizhouensis]|uniref:type VI secretion system tube protein TssD n=1 Tax=Hymenobacter sp. YIM 151500-1 TaxID=2987689 RepID=UPI00222739D8|nr:type VI secretion system tube protein TssD [Hymenobacter sp. YIM 151500-1]UYZ63388.1 HNH endonuclease [Hymenobacter sp. YIM 151500-1]